MEENDNQKVNNSGNDNLKNAMCYVPFVSFVLFFTEPNKSPEFMKHIKYGSFLFVIYILLNAILGFMFSFGILFVMYFGIIGFLGFKAYRGEDVKLEQIDKLEEKIREAGKMNDTKK